MCVCRCRLSTTGGTPSDNRSYPLPPGLGDFPLYPIEAVHSPQRITNLLTLRPLTASTASLVRFKTEAQCPRGAIQRFRQPDR